MRGFEDGEPKWRERQRSMGEGAGVVVTVRVAVEGLNVQVWRLADFDQRPLDLVQPVPATVKVSVKEKEGRLTRIQE